MTHNPELCPDQVIAAHRGLTSQATVIAGAFGLANCPERGVTVDVGDETDPPVFDVIELLRLVAETGDALYDPTCSSPDETARWALAKRAALDTHTEQAMADQDATSPAEPAATPPKR